MMSGQVILRGRVWLAVFASLIALPEAHAAFNGFMPLSYSGQVGYTYGYSESSGAQSESSSLSVGWNAGGYIWRPWFATTSMALNVSLNRADTSTSSSEGTTTGGSVSMGVFPRSRYPFSMSYSRSDSRSQQFQDLSQVSGDGGFRVTRLTLRQSYRPRTNNQIYNARYSSTQFEAGSLNSSSTQYGIDYSLRMSHQTLSVSTSHSGSTSSGTSNESVTDVWSVNHVYMPTVELGVNSLATYVQSDPGGSAIVSTDSQAFSSFFWRPEHRAINVSGGVRLTESQSEGVNTARARSLSTNLGMGYRVTRALSLGVAASVGTSDSGAVQTLSTTQSFNVSYAGGAHQLAGLTYSWQWGAGGTNSTTQTDASGATTSSDTQSANTGIGHNLSKSWAMSRSASMAATFGQSLSVSKSTGGSGVASKSLNNSGSVSWSSRSGRGSTYISGRVNDSRSFADKDTVFDSLGISYNADTTFSRLSSLTGNANFQLSRNESEDEKGDKLVSSSQNLTGGLGYRHNRPFGVYNLRFSSSLRGSRQLDVPDPTTYMQWEGTFDYRLGLLSTSLGMQASKSPGGPLSKSMNFQATRSF